MKTKLRYVLLLVGIVLGSGCEDKIYETYLANTPEYLSYEDLRASVGSESPRGIVHPGKIYFKDNYIFINEEMAGVHVIDVSDPARNNFV